MRGEVAGEFWRKLHNNNKWDKRQHFETEPFFLGLRAWLFCDPNKEGYIENWFQTPHNNSDSRATYVYRALVDDMRAYFRDSRPKEYFTRERIDLTQNGEICWAFLRDLHRAAQAIGLRGLVLCCDEFEDIIYNMRRIAQKKMAFCNMFEMFYGDQFNAQAYFAVTPEFVQKCKHELMRRGVYDYDYSQFDGLKQFTMTPITAVQLQSLVRKIVGIHSQAFAWEPPGLCLDAISTIVETMSHDSSQDRVRHCIRQVVAELDRVMEH